MADVSPERSGGEMCRRLVRDKDYDSLTNISRTIYDRYKKPEAERPPGSEAAHAVLSAVCACRENRRFERLDHLRLRISLWISISFLRIILINFSRDNFLVLAMSKK